MTDLFFLPKKKTEILFFCYKMDLGGTEKSLLSLINELDPYNFSITLVLMKDGGKLFNKIPSYVKLEFLPEYEGLESKMYGSLKQLIKGNNTGIFSVILMYLKIKVTGNWYYACEAALKNYQKTYSADIAIAYSGPSDFITYFVHQNVEAEKKIQWIHFDIDKVLANFNFGKKYYSYFDQIFCVSQSAKDIFLKNFPQFESKTSVFHNIVSAPAIRTSAEEGVSFLDDYRGVKILTVARITNEKGQQLIPEVVARLKANNFEFRWYLVGDGEDKSSVQEQSTALGITDHLLFLGEKQNPYPYMKDCDIYVQPSLHEGFCITVAEAQVFNKPIVVTNFASAKDLIENNVTGLITDISSDGIYTALKSLLLDPDLMRRLSRNSLNTSKTVESDFEKLLN